MYVLCKKCSAVPTLKKVSYNSQTNKSNFKYKCECGAGGTKNVNHTFKSVKLFGFLKPAPLDFHGDS